MSSSRVREQFIGSTTKVEEAGRRTRRDLRRNLSVLASEWRSVPPEARGVLAEIFVDSLVGRSRLADDPILRQERVAARETSIRAFNHLIYVFDKDRLSRRKRRTRIVVKGR